jgi:hypothetical protein
MRFFVAFLQDLLQSRAGCLHLCVAGVVSCLIPLLFLAASRLHKDKFASGSYMAIFECNDINITKITPPTQLG